MKKKQGDFTTVLLPIPLLLPGQPKKKHGGDPHEEV